MRHIRLHIQRFLQRSRNSLIMLLLSNKTLTKHQIQHNISLLLRLRLIAFNRRIVARRILSNSSNRSRLHQIQLRRTRIKIAVRSRFHTVQIITTKLRNIKITLQNLKFRILFFHLNCDKHFSQLTRNRTFRSVIFRQRIVIFTRLNHKHILHILLR